jgi:hypothetical protein
MSYLKVIASYLEILALAAFIFTATKDQASAQSCGELARAMGKSVDELGDGFTYVRVGSKWQDLASPIEPGLSEPTTLQGIHVVKDNTGQERIGIIVVKTGRVGPVTSPAARRVALVRRDFNSCNPSVSMSSISGEVYDGYHDFGRVNYQREELAKLSRFHTAFGLDCKQRSDADPGGFGRHYSNRAQFSYTEDVVDNGGYTGVEATLAKVGFGRAAIGKQPIAKIDRQTEIRSYSTTVGLACIKVSVPYNDDGSFFRTNDLGAVPAIDREKRYWKRDQ